MSSTGGENADLHATAAEPSVGIGMSVMTPLLGEKSERIEVRPIE
jgi:hypothetical protein